MKATRVVWFKSHHQDNNFVTYFLSHQIHQHSTNYAYIPAYKSNQIELSQISLKIYKFDIHVYNDPSPAPNVRWYTCITKSN